MGEWRWRWVEFERPGPGDYGLVEAVEGYVLENGVGDYEGDPDVPGGQRHFIRWELVLAVGGGPLPAATYVDDRPQALVLTVYGPRSYPAEEIPDAEDS